MPLPVVGIGAQQFIECNIIGTFFQQLQPFGFAAAKNIPAHAVTRHQAGPGLPHRFKPLQAQLQPERQFFRRGLFVVIFPGQQQA